MQTPHTKRDDPLVDPNVGELLCSLGELISSIDWIPTLLPAALASAAKHTVKLSFSARWRRQRTQSAFAKINNGLAKAQAGLGSLKSIPEVADHKIKRGLLGFRLPQSKVDHYRQSLRLIKKGVELIESGTFDLVESMHHLPVAELSGEGRLVIGHVANALSTLAGQRDREQVLAPILKEVTDFCDRVQKDVIRQRGPACELDSDTETE